MDDMLFYTRIFVLILSAIGALVYAWLHGVGFSLAGLKEQKPGYWKRYGIEWLAIGLFSSIFYFLPMLVGEEQFIIEILTQASSMGKQTPFYFLVLVVLIMGAAFYLTLAIATKLVTRITLVHSLKAAILPAVVFTVTTSAVPIFYMQQMQG